MERGNYSFASHKPAALSRVYFSPSNVTNKARFTHLTRKQTRPSYRLHYELCKTMERAPCHKSELPYTHVSQGIRSGLFLFCRALGKRPPQLLLCIYGHHAHACAPWAQPAFSEYRKTRADPTAALALRERQECSPGTATRGLRHPRPDRHKGQTHL